MTETLAQLTTKVQGTIGDDGTLISTTRIGYAVRQALLELTKLVPNVQTCQISTLADQLDYEVSDQDSTAIDVIDVALQVDNDQDTPLLFVSYVEDERVFFHIHTNDRQPTGKTLLVHYTKPHYINGLESMNETTYGNELNAAMVMGAAAFACYSLAASAVEKNNVETSVSENWRKLGDKYHTEFLAMLQPYRRRGMPASVPTSATWNDDQHSTEYP